MTALGSPIVIDGSHGEGGGALVRTSLVMSALTQQPVRIEGVRTGTEFPGLDYEDILLLRALARSTAAESTGVELGSQAVSFLPTTRQRGLRGSLETLDANPRRAANALVVLNALIPVLARSGTYSEVSLSGETYGHRSLSFDYFQNVTLNAYRKLGIYAFPNQESAGFGRDSSGQVTLGIEPSALAPLDWSVRGKLLALHGMVTTAELPSSIAERGVSHLSALGSSSKLPMEAEANPVDSNHPGAFVTVWAVCENGIGGATAMGQKGVRIETLAQRAFDEVRGWIEGDSTVDPYLADQLLVAACLAEGETVFRPSIITARFLTSIWVIKQFLPIHITIRGKENGPGVVTIHQ